MAKELNVGDAVVWIDEHRVEHPALVTRVWPQMSGDAREPGVNLVFVVKDESKTDPYGRQIERRTSVCHSTVQPAGAYCWKRVDE